MYQFSSLLFLILVLLIELKGNLYETFLKEIVFLFVILAVPILVVQLGSYLITKNKEKSSLIGLTFAIMFLNFGILFPYHSVVRKMHMVPLIGKLLGSYTNILLLYGLLFLGIVSLIIRLPIKEKFIKVINRGLLFLVALNGFFLLPNLIAVVSKKVNSCQPKHSLKDLETSLKESYSPDIYYIMLDGYPRHDILNALFDFDNIPFLKELQQEGFKIGDKSCSNYDATALSLPSVFDMNYLNNTSVDFTNFLNKGQVCNFLKSQGYKILSVSSSFGFTSRLDGVDEIYGTFPLASFAEYFLRKTALLPFMPYIAFFQKGFRVTHQFKTLKDVAAMRFKEPVFVFCHIMLPHLPFAFNADASSYTPTKPDALHSLYNQDDREKWIDQITVLNRLVLSAVKSIKEQSQKLPIIIIQSDHGSAWISRTYPKQTSSKKLEKLCIKERFSNLNAWYLPDKYILQEFDVITNVNTFRIVFNKYFDMKYKILDNICYTKKEKLRLEQINSLFLPSLEVIKRSLK